jgi:hypothetical protein
MDIAARSLSATRGEDGSGLGIEHSLIEIGQPLVVGARQMGELAKGVPTQTHVLHCTPIPGFLIRSWRSIHPRERPTRLKRSTLTTPEQVKTVSRRELSARLEYRRGRSRRKPRFEGFCACRLM